jgi:hypothetical protein
MHMPKEMLVHFFNVLAPLRWETRAVDLTLFSKLGSCILARSGFACPCECNLERFLSSESAIRFRPKLFSLEFDHSQFQHTPKLPPFLKLQLFQPISRFSTQP